MEFVRVEERGSVGLVTIDRPRARNALNRATLAELGAAFSALEAAPHLRAVVLTGAGDKAFVAGADIAEMSAFSAMEAVDFAAMGQAVLSAIENHPLPVIAAVHGFALGGGCELAMACDITLASSSARFGQPEVKLGVIPGFGGTQRLVRRVGSMRARELIFTGRVIDAEEALRIGLVHSVVADDVVGASLAMASSIAEMGPVAVRLAKRAVLDTDGLDLRSGLLAERNLFGLCFATEDQKEGMAAFLGKRGPTFAGR